MIQGKLLGRAALALGVILGSAGLLIYFLEITNTFWGLGLLGLGLCSLVVGCHHLIYQAFSRTSSLQQLNELSRTTAELNTTITECKILEQALRESQSREAVQYELEHRIRVEKLVAKISTHFLSLHPQEIEDGIYYALKMMGEVLGAERSYTFLFSEDGNSVEHVYEWTALGMTSQLKGLNQSSQEWLAWFEQKISTVNIASGQEGPIRNPNELFLPSEFDDSMVCIPIVYANQIAGFLGLDALADSSEGTKNVIPLLTMVGEIFMSALNRRRIEEALQRSQKEAEVAIEAKAEFLAMVSHEIRTPLNIVMSITELLEETELSHQQTNYIGYLKKSGQSLFALIEDVLSLSKLEFGNVELESIPFDLSDLIEKNYEMMKMRSDEVGLELSYEIAPDVHLDLVGDSQRLRQVILNLVGNAIKFTKEGAVHLKITRDQKHPHRMGALLFSVADTGIGIAEEKQELIFEKFTQSDSSTTRQYGGTGLGLAISRLLVELMGGEIWVESVLGQGSTFFFSVPFTVQKQSRLYQELCEQQPPLFHHFNYPSLESFLKLKDHPLNILLAEGDDEEHWLQQILSEETSCSLDLVEDGEEAFEKFVSGHYDVIVMDMKIPRMDGYDTARAIRRWEDSHGRDPIPIIALADAAKLQDGQKCFDAGCSSYLVKPLSKASLLDAVSRYA